MGLPVGVGPERLLGLLLPGGRLTLQHGVLGQTQQVIDAVAVAPTHQPPAAKTAVGSHDDANLRPRLP